MNNTERASSPKETATPERVELDSSQFSICEEIDGDGNKKTMMSLHLSSKQAKEAQGLLKISQKFSGDYSVGYVVNPELEQLDVKTSKKSIAKKSKTNYELIKELA